MPGLLFKNCSGDKVAINFINKKKQQTFQYAVTVTLDHEEIGKNPDRIKKIKPFINNKFSSEKDD